MQIAVDIFLFLVYLFLVLYIFIFSWKFFSMYVAQKYLDDFDWVMLEIRLPNEIFKSPEATEIALSALLQGGGVGTWYHRSLKGAVPAFFSLEIASLEGNVKFFIRTQKKFKALISNNFYSQYPNIEIVEAEDYVTKIYHDHRNSETNLWACEFKLGNNLILVKGQEEDKEKGIKKVKEVKMPGDYLPIKTYVDYELNKNPKEEFKIDPLTPVLEWLGSLRKGEYGWYQIMVQDEANSFNNKKMPATYVHPETHKHLTLKGVADIRLKQIKEIAPKYKKGDVVLDEYGNEKTRIKKVKKEDGTFEEIEEKVTYNKDDSGSNKKPMDLFEEEKEEIKAIGAKLSKPLARILMRTVYIVSKEASSQNKSLFGSSVQSVLAIQKYFSAPGYNTLTLSSASDPYNYDWQDTFKKRKPWRREEMFEAYVEREAFYPHIEKRKIDDWADIVLFNKSLGFRKIFRMAWEGFVHPFDHPNAEVSVVNLEELATLWHLPGQVATTPGIRRIDSVKGEAPVNLPM